MLLLLCLCVFAAIQALQSSLKDDTSSALISMMARSGLAGASRFELPGIHCYSWRVDDSFPCSVLLSILFACFPVLVCFLDSVVQLLELYYKTVLLAIPPLLRLRCRHLVLLAHVLLVCSLEQPLVFASFVLLLVVCYLFFMCFVLCISRIVLQLLFGSIRVPPGYGMYFDVESDAID